MCEGCSAARPSLWHCSVSCGGNVLILLNVAFLKCPTCPEFTQIVPHLLPYVVERLEIAVSPSSISFYLHQTVRLWDLAMPCITVAYLVLTHNVLQWLSSRQNREIISPLIFFCVYLCAKKVVGLSPSCCPGGCAADLRPVLQAAANHYLRNKAGVNLGEETQRNFCLC